MASSSSRYSYVSTVNPAGFMSVKLSPDNYAVWKEQMLCLLHSQELGYIVEEELPPPQRNDRRTEMLVKGRIFGSLSDQLLPLVIHLPTARKVWTKLEDYQDKPVLKETNDRYSKLNDREVSNYLPLYKAALKGDWVAARPLLVDGQADIVITAKQETALHIAVGTGRSIRFVQELVRLMSEEALTLKDDNGKTALAIAAHNGSTEAARMLLDKNPALLHIDDDDGDGDLPIHFAAIGGHRDTIRYLMSRTNDEDYKGAVGNRLLTYAIISGLFDIALEVLALEPYTEETKSELFVSLLYNLAERASFFRKAEVTSSLKKGSSIHVSVPVELKKNFRDLNIIDVESRAQAQGVNTLGHDYLLAACQNLNFWLWEVIGFIVPPVKKIQQKKLNHQLAVQLVTSLCEGIRSLGVDRAYFLSTCKAITKAASLGIVEVVEGIVDKLPCSVWAYTQNDENIFQLAVMNHCEEVFNLLYQMGGFRHKRLRHTDRFHNNILHMAGRLAPSHKLNLVSGAALQMQRELQWFKEVNKFIGPYYRQMKNSSGETPAMVFTREHAGLVVAGEKWIKDTSTSCTIAAALIVTVVFAATITVPGGTNGESGHPIFSNGRAFRLFGISNAISLFSSTTSLFTFLSILTGRYAEQDFLSDLPKRLVWGLLTLFLSITTMIIAFSAATYLVFGHKKWWVIVLLAVGSCVPISSFIKSEFRLLADVYRSTYGRGIFGSQSNRWFY